MEVLLVAAEVYDWIADELPGSMERNVAAALDLMHLDASRSERDARDDQVLLLRRPSKRHNRRVLDEQQEVLRKLACNAGARELALKIEDLHVRAEPDVGDEQLARRPHRALRM